MYLISIYFDADTEKKLKKMMYRVSEATGNTFMLDNHVPPHITVAAVETRHEDMLISYMEELVSSLETGKIKWVSVGSFSSKVIYIQPVLNEYLHDLSVILSKELGQMEETLLSPYYQPFSWLPHSTIAKNLSMEQMQQAFTVLQKDFVPMDGYVTRIGIAKTNPHRDIKIWEL